MALADFKAKEKKEESYEVKKIKKALKALGELEEFEKTEQVKNNFPAHSLQNPSFLFKTKQGKEYSVWYKPLIYLPFEEKAIASQPQFVFIKGKEKGMYELNGLKKQLKAHVKLTSLMEKELAQKLIKKIRSIQLVLYMKKNLTQKELNRMIITSSYLKPEYAIILTEGHVKPEIKMIIPNAINLVENIGLNEKRIKEVLKQVF